MDMIFNWIKGIIKLPGALIMVVILKLLGLNYKVKITKITWCGRTLKNVTQQILINQAKKDMKHG